MRRLWGPFLVAAIVLLMLYFGVVKDQAGKIRENLPIIGAQSAASAGRAAAQAQQMHKSEHGEYAASLSDLLQYNSTITDDPLVTFVFSGVGPDTFTITMRHARAADFSMAFTD
ncbi:MAG: hypothetical protein M5R36_04085 [Deltaproteobacteria bacterium]|nr:hypothetical protein [Deltaproteobacteria bacterium]